jgi:hypothetical protein
MRSGRAQSRKPGNCAIVARDEARAWSMSALTDRDVVVQVELLVVLGAVLRAEPGSLARTDEAFEKFWHSHSGDIDELVRWASGCSGIPRDEFVDGIDGVRAAVSAHTGYFGDDHINSLLSLYCDEPLPSFPFVTSGVVDVEMVRWAAWSAVSKCVYESLRSRALHMDRALPPIPDLRFLGRALEFFALDSQLVESASFFAVGDFIFAGKSVLAEVRVAHRRVSKEARCLLAALREDPHHG